MSLLYQMIMASCGSKPPSGAAIYDCTGGDQTFTVPADVTKVRVRHWGAGGACSSNSTAGVSPGAGPGGYVEGDLAVTPGEVLTIIVGQGGQASITGYSPAAYGGGGRGAGSGGSAGGGGGRSAIRRGGAELCCAPGGGGCGHAYQVYMGGAGGGSVGGDGKVTAGTPGGGGTQSAGGTAASPAQPGARYVGGDGYGANGGAGGGGGGKYGGGGGCSNNSETGGGGGSADTDGLTNATIISGASGPPNTGSPYYTGRIAAGGDRTTPTGGNGRVAITWGS